MSAAPLACTSSPPLLLSRAGGLPHPRLARLQVGSQVVHLELVPCELLAVDWQFPAQLPTECGRKNGTVELSHTDRLSLVP